MRTTILAPRSGASTRRRGWRAFVVLLSAVVWVAATPLDLFAQAGIVLPSLERTETRPLAQREALDLLVVGNWEVRRAAWAVREAHLRMEGAGGVLDTVIGAELNATRAQVPTESGLASGISVNEGWTIGANASRRFSPGTQVRLDLQTQSVRSVFPFSAQGLQDTIVRGPNYESRLALSVNQPILRGFGSRVTLLPVLVAQREADAAEQDRIRAAGVELGTLIVAFTEAQFAIEALDARQRSLERTERQLAIARAELDAGRIAPIELDLVHQRIAGAQEGVLLAWSVLQQRSQELGRVLGLEAGHALLVPQRGPEDVQPPDSPQAMETLCALAAANSPEIALLRAQQSRAEAALTQTADALRPSLDAAAGLTISGLDENLASSFGQLFSFEATTLFGGLVFTMPLGNAQARAQHELGLVAVDRATFEIRALEQELCRQVETATTQIALLTQRSGIAAYRNEIASRALEAEEMRFGQGQSTVQQGITALENLEAVEAEAVRVRTDLALARWTLSRLTGELARAWLARVTVWPTP